MGGFFRTGVYLYRACREYPHRTGTMRPILLKGHERPVTQLVYNNDGDLLFSASKDRKPAVWYAETGERLGTYNGHNGSVYSIDVDYHSKNLLTGSSDASICRWGQDVPCRFCASDGHGCHHLGVQAVQRR